MTTEITLKPVLAEAGAKVSSPRYSEEELKKLKKACADFESIFTYQLLKAMRQTVPESKTGMSNFGKDTYTMMMDQKLAESISANGSGLGLQKVLYNQFTSQNSQQMPKEVINKLK